jgi:hypothetical protein
MEAVSRGLEPHNVCRSSASSFRRISSGQLSKFPSSLVTPNRRHIHQAALKWERKIKWIFRNNPDPNQWQLHLDTVGDCNPHYYRLLERTPTLVFLNVRGERVTRKITYDQIGSSIPMEVIYGRLLQKRQNDHVYS